MYITIVVTNLKPLSSDNKLISLFLTADSEVFGCSIVTGSISTMFGLSVGFAC